MMADIILGGLILGFSIFMTGIIILQVYSDVFFLFSGIFLKFKQKYQFNQKIRRAMKWKNV